MFKLPKPQMQGLSLEDAIQKRRTARNFIAQDVDIKQLSSLVYACAGMTGEAADGPLRAAPSAGALYPVSLYLANLRVQGLPRGFYAYNAQEHALDSEWPGDPASILQSVGFGQRVFTSAAALFLFAVSPHLLQSKYRQLADRFIFIEVGHAAQNLLLQATSLQLGAAPLGVFKEAEISQHLNLAARRQKPVYMVAVGAVASTEEDD